MLEGISLLESNNSFQKHELMDHMKNSNLLHKGTTNTWTWPHNLPHWFSSNNVVTVSIGNSQVVGEDTKA